MIEVPEEFLKNQIIKSREAIKKKNFIDVHLLMLDTEYDDKFSFLTIINGNDLKNPKATVLRLTKELVNEFLTDIINEINSSQEDRKHED